MDYALARLSSRPFEQLVQAIATEVLGHRIVIFGAGPDGGREATYEGPIRGLGEGWHGYLVAQAKFRQRPEGSARDGAWALQELRDELDEFRRADGKRRRPDYYLFVTNAVLTPVAEAGSKDRVHAELKAAVDEGLIKDFDVWDHDKLCVFLDLYPDIRRSFAAFVLPGDVLTKMVEMLELAVPDFDQSLRLFLQKELLADQYADLEQTGDSPNSRIPLAQVFVDLPVEASALSVSKRDRHAGFVEQVLAAADQKLDRRQRALYSDEADANDRTGRFVLVGGPGQGKTTLGQFVCQLFRASLLADSSPDSLSDDVQRTLAHVKACAASSRFDLPTMRRFPVRIALKEYAARLADDSSEPVSLLRFIVERIERRIDRQIPIDEFRRWLSDYPWLLVLDGLDEVPPTSNRQTMLTAISEFWVEVALTGSDALVIATTRPQGYNEEFSPETYQHLSLTPLSPKQALTYAERLVEVRHAGEEEDQATLLDRLRHAARTDATARLMTTPLQVTIMATLAKQMGHPPQERWSLFSEYYNVIYKREMGRDIPAASVLRDHRVHIDRIHQRAALVLQTEVEVAESPQARLSHERLARLTEDLLVAEGHQGQGLEELRDTILAAAAERLVFLVGLETDQIGFELRSLQEFMAAEALMDAGDELIAQRLRAIASASAWLNVFSFCAGHCFARRLFLRDTVQTICDELNQPQVDPLASAIGAGSGLAIQLLEDGSVRSQPLYRALLTDHALKTIDRLPESNMVRLATLYSRDDESQFREAVDRALARADSRYGGYALLAHLTLRGVGWADATLRARWPTDPGEEEKLLGTLADHALLTMPAWVAPYVIRRPATTMLAHGPSSDVLQHVWGEELVSAIDSLMPARQLVLGLPPDTRADFAVTLELERIQQVPVPVPAKLPVDHHPSWGALWAVVAFSADPGPDSLADALEAIARDGCTYSLGGVVPTSWPIDACLNWARDEADLLELARAARAGQLGDLNGWLTAEQRWIDHGLSRQDLEHSLALHAPFDREVARIGAPIGAASWRIDGNTDDALPQFESWMERAADPRLGATFASLLLFMAGTRTDGQRMGLATLRSAVANLDGDPTATSDVSVLRWLDADDQPSDDIIDVVDRYGRLRLGVGWRSRDTLEALIPLIRRDPSRPGLWRLLAVDLYDLMEMRPTKRRDLDLDLDLCPAPEAALILALVGPDPSQVSAVEVERGLRSDERWAVYIREALAEATAIGGGVEQLLLELRTRPSYMANDELYVAGLLSVQLSRRLSELQDRNRWEELELFTWR